MTPTIDQFNDQPYTYDIVRKIFDVLPELRSCEQSGMLQLNLRPAKRKTLEDKLAIDATQALAPRASRKQNTVYQIDNVACILIDLERANNAVLTREEKLLLGRRFLQGYSKSEIAAQDGVSVGTVKYKTRVAIEKIVKFLNTPRKATELGQRVYKGEAYSHKRKYTSNGFAI